MNKDQLGNKSQAQNDIEIVWKGIKQIAKNFWFRIWKWKKDNNMPGFAFWIFFPLLCLVLIVFLAILVFPLAPIMTVIVRFLQVADIMNRWEKNPPKDVKKQAMIDSKKTRE